MDRLGAKNRTDAVRMLADHPKRAAAGENDAFEEINTTAKTPPQRSSLLSLPPLGGKPNNLPIKQRLFHIAQITVLSIVTVFVLILTIAGVVHILTTQL